MTDNPEVQSKVVQTKNLKYLYDVIYPIKRRMTSHWTGRRMTPTSCFRRSIRQHWLPLLRRQVGRDRWWLTDLPKQSLRCAKYTGYIVLLKENCRPKLGIDRYWHSCITVCLSLSTYNRLLLYYFLRKIVQ